MTRPSWATPLGMLRMARSWSALDFARVAVYSCSIAIVAAIVVSFRAVRISPGQGDHDETGEDGEPARDAPPRGRLPQDEHADEQRDEDAALPRRDHVA